MAVENITMPQLGESVTEGTISKWLVNVGDHVNKYDPLAEVMTDKVNAEVPSSFTGIVKELVAAEGDTLAVGEIVCVIQVEGADEVAATAVEEKTKEEPTTAVASSEKAPKVKQPTDGKPRFSPAVLKLAGEHNIDLNLVEGTGANGRITRKDILKLVESGNIPQAGAKKEEAVVSMQAPQEASKPAVPATAALKTEAVKPVSVPTVPGDIEIPVTGVRKAIAANMLRSKHEAPHAWMMIEVDVTNLVSYRNSIKGEFKKREGFNLTFFAFFVKAVAQALKEYPQINSMWAGDKIVQKKDINLSIAVATEDELFVPVIKQADEKTIKGIAREITELAGKVRTKSLKADEMQGGTFTINNTGSFGSVQSMGIINHPQAAILQVESIVKRPVIMDNGMFGARDMVNLCLSLDHRVLDGLICGKFLGRVKEILENVSADNTSVY
ncbi:branched-chain alpha-keto acid dehydrogenase subunit E2 [Bacillus pseudomycoides]|uniref:Dihydrolipoamide acetyltransferase component of pyruvate dehydrogenase complex n=1 Tax=Bacillus pseudomycoides TaxID=64104 RepID=A0AA91ZUZ6_9BACI|nr:MULTISPECIES: dihydrolipoamide acetyltransferase family protein [Bacillus]PEB53253.1 branched-chain alpha-keto acid dehydrogenase subunit E2 [Bacillus sp. AFS098217]PED83877.1 branched-chain alpha-keto acid dehydrogenase subunit E2 [Bacillus pseudomycoides]PEU14652.1 branched-chain alpha-keto acid dehydrogenase subunit E2 [Bacillus sp. AFS019443]PEU19594.1 branched-chain alpha-keto acid dehydrogenase subunit E2 [Bacillus sp. AFS014408]PFW64324.1 branched-chain alpha-keto acid dehydrogenase 